MDEYNNKCFNSIPVLKRAANCKYGKQTIIPRHQHFDYELIYVLDGSYKYQHNNINHYIKSQHGLLIRPGDWHTDFLSESSEHIGVNFIFRGEEPNFLQEISDERLLCFYDKKKIIKNILSKLLAENSSEDSFSIYLQTAYTLELYWQVLRLLSKDAIPQKLFIDEEKIRFQKKLKMVFLQNIHKFISLEIIASQLYLTPRTLHNYCHTIFGMSPVKAFMKAKMDYSMELLSQTEMSIEEISEYLGFQNPYHFSKAFKRFFNCNPSSIRQKHKY